MQRKPISDWFVFCTHHKLKSSSNMAAPIHSVGEVVEAFLNEEWVLGQITEVILKGYYTYDILLYSDGTVVNSTKQYMRKAQVLE